MYEGASGSPAGGDARLLRLEVVCVPSAASVGEQQAALGMLVESVVNHDFRNENIIWGRMYSGRYWFIDSNLLRFSLSPCHRATVLTPNCFYIINATQGN